MLSGKPAHHRKEPAMTRIAIATAYIDLTDDCNAYNVDIITAGCEYGCEAMDCETGTPVYYDNHINYASL
jgi:hypothetical protein